MNDAVDALPTPGADPTQYADVVDESLGIVSDALVSLRALPVPPGEEVALEAIWSTVDAMVEDFRSLSAALRRGDLDAAGELSQIAEASQTAANAASTEYGLTVCGS